MKKNIISFLAVVLSVVVQLEAAPNPAIYNIVRALTAKARSDVAKKAQSESTRAVSTYRGLESDYMNDEDEDPQPVSQFTSDDILSSLTERLHRICTKRDTRGTPLVVIRDTAQEFVFTYDLLKGSSLRSFMTAHPYVRDALYITSGCAAGSLITMMALIRPARRV